MRNALVLAAFAFLFGCGGGSTPVDAAVLPDAVANDTGTPPEDSGSTDWTDTPYLSASATHTFAAAGTGTEPGVDYGARIVTDVGTIVVDLTETESPVTVNSFVFLARNHFFEGIAFHRVIEGFMAQGGDPNTLTTDRASWGYGGCGYQFDNEIDPSLTFAAGGVLAMANAGPDTNGSQFFITFAAATHLNNMYNIFGHVIEGAPVLASIVRGEPPATPTRITTVQIIQR